MGTSPYKDVNFCVSELAKCRERMTSGKLNCDQFDGLIHGLGIMLMHCPSDLVSVVQSTHAEAVKRKNYAMIREAKELING